MCTGFFIFLVFSSLTGKLVVGEPQPLQLVEISQRAGNGPCSKKDPTELMKGIYFYNPGPTYSPTRWHVRCSEVWELFVFAPLNSYLFYWRVSIQPELGNFAALRT